MARVKIPTPEATVAPQPDLQAAADAAGHLDPPLIQGESIPVHLAMPEALLPGTAAIGDGPFGRLGDAGEGDAMVLGHATQPAPPEPEKIKLVATATRPMPEPTRAGLHFWARPDDAKKWIDAGWAELWDEATHGHQHAHNGQAIEATAPAPEGSEHPA